MKAIGQQSIEFWFVFLEVAEELEGNSSKFFKCFKVTIPGHPGMEESPQAFNEIQVG